MLYFHFCAIPEKFQFFSRDSTQSPFFLCSAGEDHHHRPPSDHPSVIISGYEAAEELQATLYDHCNNHGHIILPQHHLHYCKQLQYCIDHVCAVWQAACCHL